MAENSGGFLTWEVFPGMSMWALLLIIVSAIVFIVILVLFIRMRRRERKDNRWSAIYEVKDDKHRLQPKAKISIGTDNPGWEDYPNGIEGHRILGGVVKDGDDSSAIYAQPVKRSDRKKDIIREIESPQKESHENDHPPDVEDDESSALYAQPSQHSERREEDPTTSGGRQAEDLDDKEDPSALYAQPSKHSERREENDPTTSGGRPAEDLDDEEDPSALYALPFEPSDHLKEATIASFEPDDVPREAAPDSDVLYAKSMNTSFKVSVDGQAGDDGKTTEKGGKLVTVGAIALPEPSSMGGGASHYQQLDLSTVEDPSQYEELDLSNVAKARMSTGDEIPLTDL